MARYFEHKFVKKDSIEYRDYQVNLANQAMKQNCLVILPTGLGKTTVALQVIAEYLLKGTGGVLLLAPTRVLTNQHYEFLKNNLTIEDISQITGEDLVNKRKKLWMNSIICATPEITKNDLDRQIVSPNQFNLVIFDEAHRAIGDYAYVGIVERFVGSNVKIMGLTATLPSEKEKAKEILTNLRISDVAQRTEESSDVKPFIQETKTQWINVELPLELKQMQGLVKKSLDQRYMELKRNGLKVSDTKSLSQLLRLRDFVLRSNRRSAKPLFTAIRIHYALNMLESHGVTSFLRFCERTSKKKGAGIKELFENDPNFTQAISLAKSAQSKGIEHSKIPKLKELLESTEGKTLIFTSYRDSVEVIHKKLTDMKIKGDILIGKSGVKRIKQKKQIETIQKFRDGT